MNIIKNQNRDKIIELYDTILATNDIESRDLDDFCVKSWDHICLNAPVSSRMIRMIADTHKIDWRNMLSLQFYDQLYCINTYKSNKKRKSHCVGFAHKVDDTVVNGQTWDVNPRYPDVDIFNYSMANTITHHGIFGGPYVSKNNYSVTWTGVQTKQWDNLIPTPIFLFEAMNNPDIITISQFIDFESSISHSGSHSLTVTDGSLVSYIERNRTHVSVNTVSIPFAHCNTFITTRYQDNVYDVYSLKRISTMKSVLVDNISCTKILDIIGSNNHLWVNDDDWKTIYCFIFDPKNGNIWCHDRKKKYYQVYP